jgi:hypothetical protein
MNWRSSKSETRFILAMAVVITVIFAIALYGYLSGTWE